MIKEPLFSLNDVLYAVDEGMYMRAFGLFKKGHVTNITTDNQGYDAIVKSTHDYRVSISYKDIYLGQCDCYMGQRDEICKHLLALAIYVLKESGKFDTDKGSPENIKDAQAEVALGMRKIRGYDGPSSTWFRYQRDLMTGSRAIEAAIIMLPASKEHAKFIWSIVKRLDKKLAEGGVDDSDGAVSGCVLELIGTLEKYADTDDSLKEYITHFCDDPCDFDFHNDLSHLLNPVS